MARQSCYNKAMITRQATYCALVKAARDTIVWSSVEGVSLLPFRRRLLHTSLKAVQEGLPEEEITTALQIGELQGQFGR